jgi:hypothetical protein
MKAKEQAIRVTCARIEEALGGSAAFEQVEPQFYIVRQGSAYVYIQVVSWEPDRALVRFTAQLASEVQMTPDLALKLLRLNARLRFGAFGYVRKHSCVTLSHTLLGGATLDRDELLLTLRDLATIADEYDDAIVEEAGGKRMQDLLHDQVLRVLAEELRTRTGWERG